MAMLRGTRTTPCPSWGESAQIVSSGVSGIPRMAVLEDPRFREHAGPRGHPERPERLAAVASALAARREPLARVAPRAADDRELLRVHTQEHLRGAARRRGRALPSSSIPTPTLGARSVEVAELAAGGLIDLCRAVARGEAATGLAAVRPPGHHAEADRAMGFCLFNNVAIAARALQATEGVAARADPRLGRAPRQRHAAHLRGRPVGALLLDAPVPVLPGHRRLRRSGRRARRRVRR